MVADYRTALSGFGSKNKGRLGLSTGSWVCAAAVAAAKELVASHTHTSPGGRTKEVVIRLPDSRKPWSGLLLSVPIEELRHESEAVRAVVRKDSGDDTDITNGMPIHALASWTADGKIHIEAGDGVGTVRRPGLPVAVGQAAINPVPMRMLHEHLDAIRAGRGLRLRLELPWGRSLAQKTWNPRIGVEGGLSIIGTSGVIEPASSSAYRRSILASLKAYRANGGKQVWLGPGYVSEGYFEQQGLAESSRVVIGDHFGFSLDACARLGYSAVAIAAHAGKLLKLAAGIFNTHARYGDARLETLAACAAAVGADASIIRELLDQELAEAACASLAGKGLDACFDLAARRAALRASQRCGLPIRCVLLNLEGRPLGQGQTGDYRWE